MTNIIEINIENREYVDAKWTVGTDLEHKLPEGVYILRAKDALGKWFDRKVRFEKSKGWTETTAEEWAAKRRPYQTQFTEKPADLAVMLGEVPQLTPEELRVFEERRIKENLKLRKSRRFSLDRIFHRRTEDKVLKRLDPSEVKLNHIYNGDCITVMKTLPSNFFDAVITDPPYNLGKKYKSGIDDKKRAEDYYKWSYQWIDEAVRVLKPHGQLLIALWDTFKYDIKVYIGHQHRNKLRFVQEIAWETTGIPRPGSGKLRSDITPWLHFGPCIRKGEPRVNYTYNIDDIRSWKFVKHKNIARKNQRYVHPLGKDPGTLWRFFTEEEWKTDQAQNFYMLNWFRKFMEVLYDYSLEHAIKLFDMPTNVVSQRNLPGTHRDRLDHPCQMPVEVPMRLIELVTNPGDKVLDPFMGTGTAGHASIVKGRNCTGIELSPDYTLMALERLQRGNIRMQAAIEYWDGRPPEWTADPCTPQFTDPGQKSLLDFFAIGSAGGKRLGEDLVEDVVRELQATGNFQL